MGKSVATKTLAVNSVFFSLVIPTYNRAAFILKTLQSALNQTYIHFEIIVVDDGSTDDTENVVKSLLSDKVFYYKKQNAERAAARNFGTQHAKGDYITFLDSDDLLYPDYFQYAAESIKKYNNPPFLHLGYEITDEKGNVKYKINSLVSDDTSVFIKGNPMSCTGVFLEKNIARKYLFNEDRQLSGSEDWELWIRIAANKGLKTDNRITATLVDHSNRSVQTADETQLRIRKELALQYAFEDEEVKRKFLPYYRQIEAYWDSYIALHLVLANKKKSGWQYWLKSLKSHPASLFERRSLAILKHLLL
jgi:glycosyltransferase involved in cell wall biosynthesis